VVDAPGAGNHPARAGRGADQVATAGEVDVARASADDIERGEPPELKADGHRNLERLARVTGEGVQSLGEIHRLTVATQEAYASHVAYRDLITIEPGKRGGKPCVRGLRITVHDVLEYLASGMSEDEILRDFPDLTREDIRACLAFAADGER
jgi:uncharacterized protein (DUF433 family)